MKRAALTFLGYAAVTGVLLLPLIAAYLRGAP